MSPTPEEVDLAARGQAQFSSNSVSAHPDGDGALGTEGRPLCPEVPGQGTIGVSGIRCTELACRILTELSE